MYKDTRFNPVTSLAGLPLGLLMALVLSQPLTLRAEGEATTNKPLPFHITPQALENVLDQFIAATDWQVGYSPALAQGKSSSGVIGNFTPQQALTKLLAGTGLSYRVSRNNTVTVEKAAANPFVPVANPKTLEPSSETTLEKVTVEADSAYDPEYYADPYNKDYVIPNATTGTKTDTPIMETPLNVQVVSKQVLKDRQVVRLDQAFKNVSGVTAITNTAGAGRLGGTQQFIFLRGFESQTFFRNGFRLQEGSASKGLANVEAVEVLKGPAAILYGLVEPGGMVNVITKQPLATPYYGFSQQFGSYDLYRTTLDATGPIANNKDALYRVNMSYENSGSFRDLVDKEDVFFAPVLKWNINPKTQVTFELEYNHQHQGTDDGFVPFFNGQPINMPFSRFYGDYSPTTTETIFGGFNWSHQFNDDWSVKHQFSVNQRSVNSPSYTHAQLAGSKKYLQDFWDGIGFTHQTLDGLPEGSYVWRQHDALRSQNNTYSTNLDLVGHFDTYGLKHTLLMGGDYYRLDVDSLDISESSIAGSYISLNNPAHPGTPYVPFDTRSNVTSKTDQYGLYIQDQIKLPYGFQVMGGIRYQYIDQNKVEQDAVTPRVGLLWQPKKWLSLYANYVESFGANSGRVFPGTPIPPTSSEQYEGGIKAEFFEGKLRVNLAYYNLTKTNIAVGDPNIFHNCGTGGFVSGQGSDCFIALGEVRSRGPELDITGEILPGWNVIATWSNTDIIVTKSNAKNDPVISAAGGLSYTPGGRLPNVPRNTGSLWSTYEVQDGDYKGFIFGGGTTLRDGLLPYDVDGTGGYKTPGYATFDLMAGYSRQIGDAKVSVQLNVDNLLDKRYFNSFSALKNLQGSWVDFGTPRTFMGQVSVQY